MLAEKGLEQDRFSYIRDLQRLDPEFRSKLVLMHTEDHRRRGGTATKELHAKGAADAVSRISVCLASSNTTRTFEAAFSRKLYEPIARHKRESRIRSNFHLRCSPSLYNC